MACCDFYRSRYGINTPDAAFEKFVGTLQTYYDRDYYVDWSTVYANAGRYHRELLLLSSLCKAADKEKAARELLRDYPQVIPALPILIGNRGSVLIMEDPAEARVTTYEFTKPNTQNLDAEVERYAQFLLTSGLIELLDHIGSVPDYVTGVEVGIGTNGRKNRGGDCGIRAINPFVIKAETALPGMLSKYQASYEYLRQIGCPMPGQFAGFIWDWAFWTEQKPRRFVVVEVNHYGGSGSKPAEVAREYTARQPVLDSANIGFIWITDGLGWRQMRAPLRMAFDNIHHLINVRLAADGMLEWVLRRSLFPETYREEEG
ncbi:MAG TPA: DpnII family type II restriction endonuclease [Chthonomonadaceae bacterium]|nr:DpnII family type II restriction endonuclease [Chthonomonadaceae bacterium]